MNTSVKNVVLNLIKCAHLMMRMHPSNAIVAKAFRPNENYQCFMLNQMAKRLHQVLVGVADVPAEAADLAVINVAIRDENGYLFWETCFYNWRF